MTAGYGNVCVAIYGTGLIEPFAGFVRIVTGTATKYITVE